MPDITFETTVLPDAYWGVAYEASIAIRGNATAPTACTVNAVGGTSLPPGLSVAADFVRISGTVSGVGATLPKTYTFTLTMTDTAGAATSGNYTITVREPQAAIALGPNGVSPAAQQAALWPLKF